MIPGTLTSNGDLYLSNEKHMEHFDLRENSPKTFNVRKSTQRAHAKMYEIFEVWYTYFLQYLVRGTKLRLNSICFITFVKA